MATTYVIGLGRSGLAAARLLNNENHKVIVLERGKNEPLEILARELKEEGIEVSLNTPFKVENLSSSIKDIQEVIISPGISWDNSTLIKLRQEKVAISTEVSIAWRYLQDIPWVGITGTNGKTTVSYLLHHILRSNGIDSEIGGNIGTAASEIVLSIRKTGYSTPKWLIIELSSYQIEGSPELKPDIGIWTNLTPDHLERHGTMEKYRRIKASLLRNSKYRIFNADDTDLSNHRGDWNDAIWTSAENKVTNGIENDYWIDASGNVMSKDKLIFKCVDFDLPGKHNKQNLLLATAAAKKIGLNDIEIQSSLHKFKGIPHRLEKIGRISNMTIYNDSKATNFDASSIGMEAIGARFILLSGGQSKKGDASTWLNNIKNKSCGVVLFGEDALLLQQLIRDSKYKGEVFTCNNLEQAIDTGISMALRNRAKTILFSPACASFDQYDNFESRGNHFRALIQNHCTYML